jgi:hypothetical protein
VIEEHYFTDGRVVATVAGHKRLPGLRADYILELEPDFPVAVIEAKRLHRRADDGLQQAMRYAEVLHRPFAYATNGSSIVEHDFDTGRERRLCPDVQRMHAAPLLNRVRIRVTGGDSLTGIPHDPESLLRIPPPMYLLRRSIGWYHFGTDCCVRCVQIVHGWGRWGRRGRIDTDCCRRKVVGSIRPR